MTEHSHGAPARAEFRSADPADPAAAVERVMTAFGEFKTTNDARLAAIEAKGAADPLTTEKLARIDAVLAADETRNAAVTGAEQRSKQALDQAAELKTQLDAIAIKIGRPGLPGVDPKAELKSRVSTWMSAVHGSYTKGVPNLTPAEQKALTDVAAEYRVLNIGDDTGGGYLAPSAFVAEIIKNVTEISPVRSMVRVRTTANRSINLPRRATQFAALRTGELDARAETKGLSYGMIEVGAPEMYAIVDISNDALEDSAFDMQAEIMEESVEQFAVLEGKEVFNGGNAGCEGILTNAGVKSYNSGSAAGVADVNGGGDGILKSFYAIKTAYTRNGMWALNRTTLGTVRTLKDGQGRYLWSPGIADKQANTINGSPYMECPDMPSEAANASPILFGDFMRGYSLVDRIAMAMMRDPFSQADQGAVRFRFRKRTGGRVMIPEAFVKVVCHA